MYSADALGKADCGNRFLLLTSVQPTTVNPLSREVFREPGRTCRPDQFVQRGSICSRALSFSGTVQPFCITKMSSNLCRRKGQGCYREDSNQEQATATSSPSLSTLLQPTMPQLIQSVYYCIISGEFLIKRC